MTQDEMVELFRRCRSLVSDDALIRLTAWIRSDDFSFSNRDVTEYARDYVLARHEWAMSDPEWCEAMMLTRLGGGR